MRVNGVTLSAFQTNFVKELLGDTFMTDTRAEATLAKLTGKYGINALAMIEAASKPWEAKNAEFKKLEADEAAKDKNA